MSLDKEWQFIMGFLDLYQAHECLWRVKSKDYSNKLKRIWAHMEMLEYSEKYIKDVDLNWVKKKIQSLRTIFKKEVNRVEESKKSWKGTDELYVSPLWYYDLLTLTLEQPATHASMEMMTTQDRAEEDEDELVFSPKEGTVSQIMLSCHGTAPPPLK